MTRAKTMLAGIGVGMVCFVLICAAIWHGVFADDGPQIFSRKWFVSAPDHLDRKTLSTDVWFCPDSPLIEPVAVQRVEWRDTALVSRDAWGCFVFYRARVADAQLSQHLRGVATDDIKALPSWATHLPSWWHPQRSVRSDRLTALGLPSDHVFIQEAGGDVFVYWIRAP